MIVSHNVKIMDLGENESIFTSADSFLQGLYEIILNRNDVTSVAYLLTFTLYLLIGELLRSAGTQTTS